MTSIFSKVLPYPSSRASFGAGIRTPKLDHVLTSISKDLQSINLYFKIKLPYQVVPLATKLNILN